MALRTMLVVMVAAACKSGSDEVRDETIEATSTPSAGSAGGFSATLSAELGGSAAGTGPAAGTGAGTGTGTGSAGSAAPDAAGTAPDAAGTGTGTRTPARVDVPAELAAIKLSLLPSWDRDRIEAGTISLEVRLPDRSDSTTFVFGYGYDVPGAPIDREAYKKFLGTEKLLRVTNERQLGSSWYLEGVDRDGTASFRVLVTYGGKRLVCYGSLYKGSALGDYRDEVIMQAKKICETLAL